MTEQAGKPGWDCTSAEPRLEAVAAVEGEADVAVVGGGYTGLSTALFCAGRGLSAHVLEAGEIGHGGSGRNVGLVNAGVWLPPSVVIKAMGEANGPRFVERFGEGPAKVFDLIERHQIRCDAVRNGTIHAAHAPSGFRELQARYEDWAKLSAPVELLGRDVVAGMIGSRHFHGGLLDRRAGTVNPIGYVRGLARVAHAAGARISTGARVVRLGQVDGRWRVETEAGAVSARHVVLATNAYTDGLWPGLSGSFTPIHFFQFATGPLGPAVADILPGGQGVWDTGRIMMSLRRDGERLVIGSMGRMIGTAEAGISRRWAGRQLRRIFPGLGPVAFEEAWHGRIAMTPDHLPRIHRLAEGLWTAIGYNGRGITTGTLFGEALAGLLAGDDPTGLPLPVTETAAAPHAGLSRRFFDLAFVANQIWRGVG